MQDAGTEISIKATLSQRLSLQLTVYTVRINPDREERFRAIALIYLINPSEERIHPSGFYLPGSVDSYVSCVNIFLHSDTPESHCSTRLTPAKLSSSSDLSCWICLCPDPVVPGIIMKYLWIYPRMGAGRSLSALRSSSFLSHFQHLAVSSRFSHESASLFLTVLSGSAVVGFLVPSFRHVRIQLQR